MIKILFDHEIFSEQRYGGISRYFANLAMQVNQRDGFKVKIGVLLSKNHYIKNIFQLFNNILGRWFLRKDGKRYRWNKQYCESLFRKANYDIFHATYYDNYSIGLNKKPMVVTIHDMIHETSPQMFSNSAQIIAQKKRMMDAANAIIAISNYTKDEILKIYPDYEPKIKVVYHGIITEVPVDNDIRDLGFGKYILFVGERGHYKNFNVFAKSLAPLLSNQLDLKIICAGGKSFTAQESERLMELGIEDACIQIDVDDDRLRSLYQQALLFVYPSSQEGFGLPLLEAFSNNCPVACSNRSCLPEIGGDAVAYFNPDDLASILLVVKSIINNSTYANELRLKGKDRLNDFKMEDCIDNTLKVYSACLKSEY